MSRGITIGVVIAAGVALSALGARVSGSRPGAACPATRPGIGDVTQTITISGVLIPLEEGVVWNKTAARVERVFVKRGESVRAGAPLVALEADQLRKTLEKQLIVLKRAQAHLAQASPPSGKNSTNVERELASIDVEQALDDVRTTQRTINDMTIRAPIAGTVLILSVQKGDVLAPNNSMALLSQIVVGRPGWYAVEATVGEFEAVRIHTDMAATVARQAVQAPPVHGVVTEEPTVRHLLPNGGSDFLVRLVLREPLLHALPGENVSVQFRSTVARGVYVVPRESLVTHDGRRYVLRVTKDGPEPMLVNVGVIGDSVVQLINSRLMSDVCLDAESYATAGLFAH